MAKPRILILYAVMALLLPFLPASAPAADPLDSYTKGLSSMRSGDFAKAEEYFLAAEKASPYHQEPTYALALLRRDAFVRTRHGYVKARETFSDLEAKLAANPPGAMETGLYISYMEFADLLLRGTEDALALAHLEKFKEVYPDFYEMEKAENMRGVALFRLGRYEEAAEAFRKAMAINPDFLEPRVNFRALFLRLNGFEEARLAHRTGHYKEALDLVDDLLKIAAGYTQVLALKGTILRDAGRTEEAMAVYGNVLAEDPDAPVTHGVRLDMAAMLEKKGDLRGALDLLNANASRFRKIPNDPTRGEILRLINLLKAQP